MAAGTTPSKEEVLKALSQVTLPEGSNIVEAGMVKALSVKDGRASFVLEIPAGAAERFEPVRRQAEEALSALPGIGKAMVVMTAPAAPGGAAGGGRSAPPTGAAADEAPPDLRIGRHPRPQAGPVRIPGVRHVVAVASGKGGVGKSTLSANLAAALRRKGRKVGLLDADIYGPSQPKMLGAKGRPKSIDGKTILPVTAHGIRLMSLGLMVPENEAVIWRGPMLIGALQQLLQQVDWGGLDWLVIDLPPGTGDVQLTLSQKADIDGAVVVSTPQDVALLDARKAIDMFRKTKTPILGLVENMAAYHCPKCGHEAHIFGEGGVRREAEALGVPFLGEVPLSLEIRLSGDLGEPVALGDGPMAEAYGRIADGLIAALED